MKKTKFKKGAASFYVVAFSTLILLIIVASFTALVVAQITRSSNADLAQSAYDSAMAGVEDAKLAFYSYRNCLDLVEGPADINEFGTIGCEQVIALVENKGLSGDISECDRVSIVLGRKTVDTEEEDMQVSVDESAGDNSSLQAYTCVKLQTDLRDYRATLSSERQMKIVRPIFDDDVSTDSITKVRISWGSADDITTNSLRFSGFNPVFESATKSNKPLNPPVLSVALLQTGENFQLSQFDETSNGQTNRGLVFLVPWKKGSGLAANSERYTRVNNGIIGKEELVASNDKVSNDKPFAVQCDPDAEAFMCSVTIELPKPIGGTRAKKGLVFAVSLPYGKPSTDFSMEFCRGSGDEPCGGGETEGGEGSDNDPVLLKGMQIGVDSTGRTGDLFRRVETRLEEEDDTLLSLMGPLELFGENGADGAGTGNSEALKKDMSVLCEWNFGESAGTLPGCTGE